MTHTKVRNAFSDSREVLIFGTKSVTAISFKELLAAGGALLFVWICLSAWFLL